MNMVLCTYFHVLSQRLQTQHKQEFVVSRPRIAIHVLDALDALSMENLNCDQCSERDTY